MSTPVRVIDIHCQDLVSPLSTPPGPRHRGGRYPRARPAPRELFPEDPGDESRPRQRRRFNEPEVNEEIANRHVEAPAADEELEDQDEEAAAEEEDDDPVAGIVEEGWMGTTVSESDGDNSDSSKTIPFQLPKY